MKTREDLEAAVIAVRSTAVVTDVITRRAELREVCRMLNELAQALRKAIELAQALLAEETSA